MRETAQVFIIANSIPIYWLYILTACIRVSNSFSFLANSLISSMYIRWLIFSCDLWSLYPHVHFLCTWLSGIIAITNRNCDRAPQLNIPQWIFTAVKLFPPAVCSTHQISMVFSIKFITSPDILYIWDNLLSSLAEIVFLLRGLRDRKTPRLFWQF